jgi:hypothetical protein
VRSGSRFAIRLRYLDRYMDLVQEQFAEINSQKHLYLIVKQFVDLVGNLVKQA